jgi:hypothetical protein
MAGIVVDYARFIEVQQRRARLGAHRVRSPRQTCQETNGSTAVDRQPLDSGESRQQVVSTQEEAAHHRGGTTLGTLDG